MVRIKYSRSTSLLKYKFWQIVNTVTQNKLKNTLQEADEEEFIGN